jgi:hypothetical protein
MIAIVLALGGCFWGVFLLLAFGPAALIPLPFGVGYLVTAGYIARSVTVPTLGVRRAVWVASLVVQGAWLLSVGIPDLPRTGPNLFFWWWAFATAASAVALVTERGSADAEPFHGLSDLSKNDDSLHSV